MDTRTFGQPGHDCGIGAVAADQSIPTADPDVAKASNRRPLGLLFDDDVEVIHSTRPCAARQFVDLGDLEPAVGKVELGTAEPKLFELEVEGLLVKLAFKRHPVLEDAEQAQLLVGQMLDPDHRHMSQFEQPRGGKPGVA